MLIVEPKQERADDSLTFIVAESADHAVGSPLVLDLLHSIAQPRAIRQIPPLGDNAIEGAAGPGQPSLRFDQVGRGGREPEQAWALEVTFCEHFQGAPPVRQ